jgi:PAS domain S-box-containing protein
MVMLFPVQLHFVMDSVSYLLFHNIAEFFSIMVSLSIFGVGWHTYSQSKDRHALFLSAAFLSIGLMDFIHTLASAAMPVFVTPNSTNKSAQFWVAARLLSALAFLSSAYIYKGRQTGWLAKAALSRTALMTAALAIPALVFTGVTFYPSRMPDAFVAGVGLTSFKVYSEYLIVCLLCLAAGAYWKRMARSGDELLIYYVVAFIICAASELVFTAYKIDFDIYNVLGHTYKIVAFYLIYKGIFVSSVRNPYIVLTYTNTKLDKEIVERRQAQDALQRAQAGLEHRVEERTRALRESEQRWATTLASIGDGVIATDASGNVSFMNIVAEKLTGWTLGEAAGKPAADVFRIINEQTRAEVISPISRVLREGMVVGLANHTILVKKDGTEVPVDDSGAPIKDRDGKTMGVVLAFRDITERKRSEEALQESERRVRLKLESILAPAGDIGNLELSDIIDVGAMQTLMDGFNALVHVPMAIVDLRGKVVVGNGWQDICTKFHRAHPETCEHCVESDTQLSRGVSQGEFKLYKCKNNMWDIATPIMVGGQQVGNVFSGQFFFEDEPVDYELFRSQARQYGFDEANYISALDNVPRLSKESVDLVMSFLMKLSHMLSRLSYSNIKLARSLAQGDALTGSLREREEQLRLFVEHAPAAIAMFDTGMHYIAVSNRWVTDYSLEGRHLMGLCHYQVFPDVPGRWKEIHQRALSGTVERAEEDRFERADGSIQWIRWEVHPWRSASGVIGGIIIFSEDITERKRAEEELKKTHDALEQRVRERTAELSEAYEKLQAEVEERKHAEDRLRQSQKMEAMGTLAGGIAHDFNNILAAIIGFTEMAIEDIPDHPEVKKSLGNVLKSAMRARDLVKQILAFSRKTSHERNPLPLTPLIKETIQLLRASIPTTIEIRLSVSATSDTVLAAPVEVQQVVMNLATNASLAMQERGGTMEISVTDIDFESDFPIFGPDVTPGEYVQLTVKDTGIGMTPDVLKRVFEPFFTTREVGKGTGMGLAMVYGIVEDLQGTITVESELGAGSTFRVLLPKLKTDAKPEVVQAVEIPGGNERMLFLDDEQMLVEWGETVLERLGYQVTALTDSTDALKTFSSDPFQFDLVITDQTMPGIPGLQLSQELLKIRPDIPIILCTGHSDTVSPETAKKAGIREFLMKPLVKQELAQVIRRTLDANKEE